MTQLHNLESNVAGILMEASLKLCSLTDINIFFLVETAEGRRFAGNPKFCDQFRQEGLLAAETDIECAVNPAISGLEERAFVPFRPSSQVRPQPAPNFRNGFNSPKSFSTPPRKRSLPISQTTRPAKAFKPTTPTPPPTDAVPDSNNGGVNEDSSIGDDLDLDHFEPDHFDTDEERDVLSIDLKEEDPADAGTASNVESFSNYDLTDDDIVEVPLSDRAPRPRTDDATAGSSSGNDSYSNWQLTPSYSVSQRAQKQSQLPNPVMDFVNDIYPQSLLDKLNALDSFEVDVIFDPGAAPRKVLNSILHEVGTKLAYSCPYWPRHLSNPQLKEFLISNIEVFIGKFPVMQRICNDMHKVFIGKKAMSKLTYVKNNIRSSYDKQFKGGLNFGYKSGPFYSATMLAPKLTPTD